MEPRRKSRKQAKRPARVNKAPARKRDDAIHMRLTEAAGVLALTNPLFEPRDFLEAATQCGLKPLPDADTAALATMMNNEAFVAASFLQATRPPKRDSQKRKTGAVQRGTAALMRILGLPTDLDPIQARGVRIAPAILQALQVGANGISIPPEPWLITLIGGRRALKRLVNHVIKSDKALEAKAARLKGDDKESKAKREAIEDERQELAQLVDRKFVEAALKVVAPWTLSLLLQSAKAGSAVTAGRKKRRARGDAEISRPLIRALAEAHEKLFGRKPSVRDSEGGRKSRSVEWVHKVLSRAAQQGRADPRRRATPQVRVVWRAANLTLDTLSDALQAGLRANRA